MCSAGVPVYPAVTGHGLVIPRPGERPLARAFSCYLSLCFEAFVGLGVHLPAAMRATHRRVVDIVHRVRRERPRAVSACLASPTVGTALHCLHLRTALPAFRERIDAAAVLAVPHLLLELSIREAIPVGDAIDWPHGAPSLASPSLGLLLQPPPGTNRLRFANNCLWACSNEEPRGKLRFEQGRVVNNQGFVTATRYHPVGGITRLATIDHNPIAEFETHPHKSGNHVDLGGHTEVEWIAALESALSLVEEYCPEIFEEMKLLLHEVIPVGYDPERHLSASYREAIGTVYLTLHPDVMTLAEALVHEFQHNKLNLASYAVDFLENPFDAGHPSPVRPDPRPLWGILLAVHAFLPVAVLYRRMRAAGHPLSLRPEFERRLAQIDRNNHDGMEVLRTHARWTAPGLALWQSLEALDRAHMSEH